jgi:hypothetical protein
VQLMLLFLWLMHVGCLELHCWQHMFRAAIVARCTQALARNIKQAKQEYKPLFGAATLQRWISSGCVSASYELLHDDVCSKGCICG